MSMRAKKRSSKTTRRKAAVRTERKAGRRGSAKTAASPRRRASEPLDAADAHTSARPAGLLHVPYLDPGLLIAALLGCTLGLLAAGGSGSLSKTLGSTAAVDRSVLAGVLLALATGLGMPRGVALWLTRMSWRRLLRPDHQPISPLPGGMALDVSDRPLHWTTVSVLAFVAGVMAAGFVVTGRGAGLVWRQLHDHFVWSTGPEAALRALLAFAAALPAMATIGLLVPAAHRLTRRACPWDSRATAFLLAGAGVGVLLAGRLRTERGLVELSILAGALGPFMTSLLAVGMASPKGRRPEQASRFHDGLPERSERWPGLLRWTAGVLWVCAVWSVASWAEASSQRGAGGHATCGVSLVILAVGVGTGLALRSASLGRLGNLIAVVGLVGGLGGLVPAWWSEQSLVLASGVQVLGLMILGAAAGIAQGAALDHGSGSRSAGPRLLSDWVLLGSLLVWVGLPMARLWLSPLVHLALCPLVLLGLGAVLVICEPAYSPTARNIRLAGILGGVCSFLVMVPITTARAHQDEPPLLGRPDITAANVAEADNPGRCD